MENEKMGLKFMPYNERSSKIFMIVIIVSIVLAFILPVICLLCEKFDACAPLCRNVLPYLIGIFLVILLYALHVLKFIYKSEMTEKQKDGELSRKIAWEHSLRALDQENRERREQREDQEWALKLKEKEKSLLEFYLKCMEKGAEIPADEEFKKKVENIKTGYKTVKEIIENLD